MSADLILLTGTGGGGSGTVTNIATSAPLAGGPITTTGTISITGAAGQVLAGAGPAFTATPTLGVAGATLGTLTMAGNTSGTLSLTPNATATALTMSAAQFNIGTATGGNGVLGLAGNTSGTATLTAPAVAGTTTNPIVISNAIQIPNGSKTGPAIVLPSPRGVYYAVNGSAWTMSDGTNDQWALGTNNATIVFVSSGSCGWSSSGNVLDSANSGRDTSLSRMGAGIVQVGSGTGNGKNGLLQSGMTTFVTSNFTTAANTNLQTITGLSITVPAVAANWSFHVHLAFSQATGTAAVSFGIQAATNAPTNIFATGTIFTAPSTVTAPAVTGVLPTLTTTTATAIVTGTPNAIGTNLVCDLYGTCELGASANTINIMVSTATAADAVTVLRGSYFSFTP